VTATANSGYTFATWTENGIVVSSSANYTLTLILTANPGPLIRSRERRLGDRAGLHP
jgi:Divergent InlB B-repeat domain